MISSTLPIFNPNNYKNCRLFLNAMWKITKSKAAWVNAHLLSYSFHVSLVLVQLCWVLSVQDFNLIWYLSCFPSSLVVDIKSVLAAVRKRLNFFLLAVGWESLRVPRGNPQIPALRTFHNTFTSSSKLFWLVYCKNVSITISCCRDLCL